MNTTDKNILLAEFMGFKLQDNPNERFYNNWLINSNAYGGRYNFEEFYFDVDWNWLMEVVEKIEGLQWDNEENEDGLYSWTPNPFKVNIMSTNAEICLDGITDGRSKVIDNKKYSFYKIGKTNSKIESTFETCVAFIEWYNKQ